MNHATYEVNNRFIKRISYILNKRCLYIDPCRKLFAENCTKYIWNPVEHLRWSLFAKIGNGKKP